VAKCRSQATILAIGGGLALALFIVVVAVLVLFATYSRLWIQSVTPSDAAARPVVQKDHKGAPAVVKTWDEYPLQDNPLAGCSICHVDIEDQFVGSIHFEEKVGCKTCHGPSEGHLADENNEVKPEEVFAREDVDRLCGRCHECFREIPAEPELAADGKPKVCIDCHGAHDVKMVQKDGDQASH
jgi:hypothetical protein